MLGRWTLFVIAVAGSHAHRLRVASEHRDWQDSQLNVRLWTWNSGKADLHQEALRLSQTDADYIVSCQTEASKPISKWMPAEWKEVAHGEHWGAAGGNVNAQMASVFVRRPVDGKFMGNRSEVKSLTPWSNSLGHEEVMKFSRFDGTDSEAFRVRTQVIATDYKGKGGVAISLSFPETLARRATRIDFICAHLDSEAGKARHKGITYMLSRVRSDQDRVSTWLQKEVLSEKLRPCALFDRASPTCGLPEVSDIEAPPDAVVLLGDLNFRLRQGDVDVSEESPMAAEILSPGGRRELAAQDPLWPQSPYADSLVKPVEADGFGFSCNEPYAAYLPSYKRHGGAECKLLGEQLRDCSSSYCKQDDLVNLTRSCYMKRSKKDGNLSWAVKRTDLQLGWLDRFCFRATSGREELMLSVIDDTAWMDTPGAEDSESGSDHMPVAATMQVGYAKCSCPSVLSTGIILEGCEQARGPIFRTGDRTVMRCLDDAQLVDQQGRIFDSVAMQCMQDGSIMPLNLRGDIDGWTCRKVCRDYPIAEQLHLGLPVVEGRVLHPSCSEDSELLGAKVLRCEEGVLVQENGFDPPPVCVAACRSTVPDGLWVRFQWPAKPEILDTDYRPEIMSRFGRSRQTVLDGGEQSFECRRSCTVLGPSTTTCAGSQFHPPPSSMRCACGMSVSVEAVDFASEAVRSQVSYIKLQFFKRAADEDNDEYLEAMRQGHQKYVGALKFQPKNLPDGKVLDGLTNLAELDAHLTLCSKSAGKRRHYFSSCGVLSETQSSQAQKLHWLLGQVNSTEGTLVMDFKLAWEMQNTTGIKVKVRYTVDAEK